MYVIVHVASTGTGLSLNIQPQKREECTTLSSVAMATGLWIQIRHVLLEAIFGGASIHSTLCRIISSYTANRCEKLAAARTPPAETEAGEGQQDK